MSETATAIVDIIPEDNPPQSTPQFRLSTEDLSEICENRLLIHRRDRYWNERAHLENENAAAVFAAQSSAARQGLEKVLQAHSAQFHLSEEGKLTVQHRRKAKRNLKPLVYRVRLDDAAIIDTSKESYVLDPLCKFNKQLYLVDDVKAIAPWVLKDGLKQFTRWLQTDTKLLRLQSYTERRSKIGFVGWDLRNWVQNQKRHGTDQNLFCDVRYDRQKMKYVPRKAGRSFTAGTKNDFADAVSKKLGAPTVYDGDGGSGNEGGTARPAGVHWEGRAIVRNRAMRDYGTRLNFDGTVTYELDSAALRSWNRDIEALSLAFFGGHDRLPTIKLPVALVRIPSDGFTTVGVTNEQDAATWYFQPAFWMLRQSEFQLSPHHELRRQKDSSGVPLYFPRLIDETVPYIDRRRGSTGWNEGRWLNVKNGRKPSVFRREEKRTFVVLYRLYKPADVDKLVKFEENGVTVDPLKELMQIWEDRLKECGLNNPEGMIPVIRTWKETTQAPKDVIAEAAIITDGIRLLQQWGMISAEQKERDMAIVEKLIAGDPLDENERQRKHEMLTSQMQLNEMWYQAEQRLRQENNPTSGLYALVKLPRKAPRAYFLMDEPSAVRARDAILAAQGDVLRAPYVLVKIEQARISAAERVKGKDRKTILQTFQNAPLHIISF